MTPAKYYKFLIKSLVQSEIFDNNKSCIEFVECNNVYQLKSGAYTVREIGIVSLASYLLDDSKKKSIERLVRNLSVIKESCTSECGEKLPSSALEECGDLLQVLSKALSGKFEDIKSSLVYFLETPRSLLQDQSPLCFVWHSPSISIKGKHYPVQLTCLFYMALSLFAAGQSDEDNDHIDGKFTQILNQIKHLDIAESNEKNVFIKDYIAQSNLDVLLLATLAERSYVKNEYKKSSIFLTKLIEDFANKELRETDKRILNYSLQRRSSCYYHLARYEDAIVDCTRLRDSKDYRVFQTLGACLAALGETKDAIINYRNSLILQEHWLSYKLLANEYSKNYDHINAIYCCKKSLMNGLEKEEFTEIMREVLKIMKSNFRKLSARKSRSLPNSTLRSAPINTFDPSCGVQYYELSRTLLEEKKNVMHAAGYTFLSSSNQFASSSDAFWRNLVFVHIPKCRGTSFQLPLQRSYDAALAINKASHHEPLERLFSYGNIHNSTVLTKIQSALLSDIEKPPRSIFCSPHGCNWESLVESVELKNKIHPNIVMILRNPQKRLMSNIRHYLYYSNSISDFRRKTKEEFYNFDNCLYRYLFSDFGEFIDKRKALSLLCERLDEVTNRVSCFAMDDDFYLNQIKMLYLSAAGLPNVLHWSRLKDSYDREKEKSSNWSDDEVISEYQRIVSSGGLDLDISIPIEKLIKISKKKLKLPQPSCEEESDCLLHPFTLVIDRKSRYRVVETKSLFV